MRDVDEAILSLLTSSGLELTPSNIAENTGYSSGYVRKRCAELTKHGVLEKDDAGSHPFYRITEDGQSYCAGESEVEKLEDGDQ